MPRGAPGGLVTLCRDASGVALVAWCPGVWMRLVRLVAHSRRPGSLVAECLDAPGAPGGLSR